MFGLGMPEMVVILVIALIVFGGGKLPEVMGSLGKGIKEFKKSMADPGRARKPMEEGQNPHEEKTP